MRMLNSVQLPGCTDVDLYPQQLQSEIDEINELVYDKVRLVVSTCGANATDTGKQADFEHIALCACRPIPSSEPRIESQVLL